jgi:3-deoxy-D-manno-octulosonic-acid transferase
MTNFKTVANELNEANGAIEVTDANALANAVSYLLANPEEAASISEAAANVAANNYAVVDLVMESLSPFLDALPHEDTYASA